MDTLEAPVVTHDIGEIVVRPVGDEAHLFHLDKPRCCKPENGVLLSIVVCENVTGAIRVYDSAELGGVDNMRPFYESPPNLKAGSKIVFNTRFTEGLVVRPGIWGSVYVSYK